MENNWHDIPGYEWLYQFNWHTNEVKRLQSIVSTCHKSKKIVRERILKPYIDRWRYIKVVLSKEWKIKSFYLGSLTLLITKWHKPRWMVSCHIDWNQWNNFPENLKYGTYSENTIDSIRHGTARCVNQNKKVRRIDINGNEKVFNSLKEAMYDMWKGHVWSTSITRFIQGRVKTAYGYRWEYIT